MYNYIQQITEFIQANFSPGTAEDATNKMTSSELLSFLFNTFPDGCISDFDLNDIMQKLDYKRTTYSIEIEIPLTKKEKEENKPQLFTYHLCSGWCLNSIILKAKLTN